MECDALCGDEWGVRHLNSGQRPEVTHTVNRWIIGEVARARIAVDDALATYRFNDAANTLYAFVWREGLTDVSCRSR